MFKHEKVNWFLITYPTGFAIKNENEPDPIERPLNPTFMYFVFHYCPSNNAANPLTIMRIIKWTYK